jgi:hypothetical protein
MGGDACCIICELCNIRHVLKNFCDYVYVLICGLLENIHSMKVLSKRRGHMRQFSYIFASALLVFGAHSARSQEIPERIPLPYTAAPDMNCENCFDVGGYKTGIDCNKFQPPAGVELKKSTEDLPFYVNEHIFKSTEPFLSKVYIRYSDETSRYDISATCTVPLYGSAAVYIGRTITYDDNRKAPSAESVIDSIYGKYGKPNNESIKGSNGKISYILDQNFKKTSAKSQLYYGTIQDNRAVFVQDLIDTYKSGVGMSLTFTLYSCLGEPGRICTIESHIIDFKSYVNGRIKMKEEHQKWKPVIDAFVEKQRFGNQSKAPKL